MNVQDMIKSSSKTSNPFAVTEWDSYIGQAKAKKRVQLMIKAAKNRGEQIDHQLILGSSGTGKTTLGRLIAKEHNVPFMSIMMTPSFSMEALASKLVAFDEDTIDENGELQTGGGICLLDEAHLLKAGQQHFLYSVLEDGYIPYNNGAKYFFQNRVTILAATTDEQRLSEALRGRFDNPIRLEEYTAKEMAQIVEGMCHKMGFEGTIQNYVDIANASAGRPRQAGALVRTARDLGEIDMPSVLEFAMITPEGLTIDDVAYLRALHQLGGKAGIKNIASLSMRDQKVVESLERDLVHRGLVNVTRGGREMTVQGLRTLDRLPEYM